MVRISRNRIDLENARIDRAFLNKHHQVTVGGASGASSGASYTINLNNANVFHVVLTANCTFTFSNPHASGIAHSFTLFLGQDATGGRTVTWPNSVQWAGGTAPTITSTNQQTDIYSFLTVDGGTGWFGFVGGQDYDYGLVVAPGAPENLEVTDFDDGEIDLAWDTPNSDGGSAITGYKVYRDTSASPTTLIDTIGVTNSYNDSTVTNGVTYYYRVKATNAIGDSAYSSQVSGTPDGNGAYIAIAHATSPYFTLLNHTTPGTVSLATTYTLSSGTGNGVEFSPDGNYIAVANDASPRFTLLNHTTPGTVSLATTYTVPGAGWGTAFSPDGNYIAVTHSTSPYFTLLNHTTPGTVSLATTYVLGGTEGNRCVFSPDGNYIVATYIGGTRLALLHRPTPGTLALAATYTLPNNGLGVDFSPDGNYIAVANSNTTPYFTLLNHTTPGTLSLAATYTMPSGSYDTAFSPDGNYIGVVYQTSPYFTLLNHTTPGTVSLATTYTIGGGGIARSVNFSPNGKYIAIAHDNAPRFTLLRRPTPSSLALSATYTVAGNARSVSLYPV